MGGQYLPALLIFQRCLGYCQCFSCLLGRTAQGLQTCDIDAGSQPLLFFKPLLAGKPGVLYLLFSGLRFIQLGQVGAYGASLGIFFQACPCAQGCLMLLSIGGLPAAQLGKPDKIRWRSSTLCTCSSQPGPLRAQGRRFAGRTLNESPIRRW